MPSPVSSSLSKMPHHFLCDLFTMAKWIDSYLYDMFYHDNIIQFERKIITIEQKLCEMGLY